MTKYIDIDAQNYYVLKDIEGEMSIEHRQFVDNDRWICQKITLPKKVIDAIKENNILD